MQAVKRVLIIAYYWPPSGGPGVQRWLKFVKYLRRYGWEPIVYTAENAEYPVLDPSLEKEIPEGVLVVKQPIWEPYGFYKKLIGQKKEERVVSGFLQDKKSFSPAHKFARWIRGNIFIPDARRFWIRPSVKFLRSWIKDNPVDMIISTGPPYSMHLIGLGLKERTNLPWIADFRDPWANISFAGDLYMSKWARKQNARLESKVLNAADHVLVVGKMMQEEFFSKTSKPVSVITNGFDSEDFENVTPEQNSGYFTLVHTGSLSERQNQPFLWEVLSRMRKENPQFKAKLKIKLIGKNDASVLQSLRETGLEECTEIQEYVPHSTVVSSQLGASVLLLSINNYGDEKNSFFSPKAILTGKLFEYLAARRPVLFIGPSDSQGAEIVTQCNAGTAIDFNDKVKLQAALINWFREFEQGPLQIKSQGIEQFSRENLTRKLATLMNDLVIKGN